MYKLESTSDTHRYLLATSHMGEHALDLGVAAPPQEAVLALPERYGIPLLELLVVDTRYVFVSWEITSEQMAQARLSLGKKAFASRKLKILFHRDTREGEVLLASELFGDIGRWFIRLDHPGTVVLAELLFISGPEGFLLSTAGPLSMPREEVVEPDEYDELRVSYGHGRHGRLILLGLDRRRASWPHVTLPAPLAGEYTPARLPAAPGSPGLAWQAAPSSGALASWTGEGCAAADKAPSGEP